MDWNDDGNDDHDDGLIEGAFIFGPWWVSLAIILILVLLWTYHSWFP